MMGGFGMGSMWIIWIIIIIAVILLAKRYFSQTQKESEPTSESALDLLKKRYARGEIGREEFEEKKRDLM